MHISIAMLRCRFGACLLPLILAASPASATEHAGGTLIDATGWSDDIADDDATGIETDTIWIEVGEDADKARLSGVGYGEPVVAPSSAPLASYGPFHLTAADTVEMIGTVDSDSPAQFAALMAAHPAIVRLVMVECPGSVDEAANHALARRVRAAGLVTIVPAGGSVRSGAVDLFLAGVRRIAAPGAEFGVHSWRDEDGNQPDDFGPEDAVHGEYLRYYREMGLSEDAARRFYALTNSAPFEDVLMLAARDMARLGLAEVAG